MENISIVQHCWTGIPKLETFDENAHGMSTDNKGQLVLFDVIGLPIKNVPIELVTCLNREVLDNGGTSHAEPYGKSAPSPLPWSELQVGGGVFLPFNYITRPLPSTYDQKLSLLRHTVFKTKA